MVLGRKKRSLQFKPLNLMKTKQANFPNGTLTAQLDKSLNGTTRGNFAFLINKTPSYLWTNPLTKILTKNNTEKKVQWQFNASNPLAASAAGAGGGATAAAPKPAAAPAPAPKPAAPKPASAPAPAPKPAAPPAAGG